MLFFQWNLNDFCIPWAHRIAPQAHRIVPWAHRCAPRAHNMASWRPDWVVLSDSWWLMLAFKWSWAVPERSGVVPGGSRARIIDFSLVFEGFSGFRFVGPRTAENGPGGSKDRPKTAQEAPRSARERPKRAPRWPKMAPKRAKTVPRWSQDGPQMAQKST